ncbi:MAG: hypothetical protein A3H69_02075 [Candidatus Sungbacteria bacterium RIFCSPLOWO2_02_FULL_47_9]|uniref:Bacterial bifunctional deaminase-reductase C-terminal domain-containing protein n=1 Tax=Candidatus Sungbacteria bacterium RIFCSPHIGHO2_01_FULL_47_32 TaxID=1802264 RepID=A0A1G2K6R0_9BACT|nr:MAG: hypothetical protein UX72_C0001G0039 [Parcubacteria group bacterium GW2011_GWA2_47_10]OGZ94261.1 MAG: hypothetical protein A2633_05625 [Candidatus Sungbacteria bacterium RIFCSPHIGHO2_01_FULL_47_32]OGZ99730.1 MAG: hypothetical protein A3D57_02415 [Candidatus Sungbacteria bacterium RIFCSPHIGHO2_02_FULL_46_12]OHA05902.1 MAG: hypothetical protein A3A28_02755 [Candidatus Sungbacteria bacterium RIFCSPLOWO2_01_FULL_47_32]OHA08600.1 MAG: hypothetical protein A3H69_02075 [Candidatus Sungbacteria
MVTLYNVTSSDGFIARKDGSEDFIPDNLWVNFLNLCKEYGTIIMGRKTYDTIQKYDQEILAPFEKLPIRKIVVTANPKFFPKQGYIVARSPEDAVLLAPNALVSSGPTLNDYFLKNGFVKKIIIHQVSIAIEEGIKPFEQNNATLVPVEGVPQLDGVRVKEYVVV